MPREDAEKLGDSLVRNRLREAMVVLEHELARGVADFMLGQKVPRCLRDMLEGRRPYTPPVSAKMDNGRFDAEHALLHVGRAYGPLLLQPERVPMLGAL